MDVLIRELSRTAEGRLSYRDTEIDTQTISIGSADDQLVQLYGPSVAQRHASLVLGANEIQLRCRRGCEVLVNGASVHRAQLSEGDVLTLDGHRMELVAPPSGFVAALEVERDGEAQRAGFERSFRTGLGNAWFSKRMASWVLLGLVLVLGLAAPLLWQFDVLSSMLATRWLPDHQIWSSGPLLPAHQLAVAGDCGACHQRLLERVTDESCLECHAVTPHLSDASLASAGLEPERCAACHREHNEPPRLIAGEDWGCIGCHQQPDLFGSDSGLEAVSAFNATEHPAFDARLMSVDVVPHGTGLVFDWRVHRQPVAIAREDSQLEFSHQVHLDAGQVQRVDNGEALGCGDCHVLSSDRARFVPIDMRNHCQSCHDLTFDPTDPSRQLPHGEPIEVVMTIEGHFMRKFLAPADDREVFRRRVPDRPERDVDCTNDAYRCAVNATLFETESQFTQRGCITCHTVAEHADTEIYTRFQVYPVRLGQDYFPSLRFDHAQHQIQGDAVADQACLNCHLATTNDLSANLMLPDLDTCLSCHDEVLGQPGLSLGCRDCHSYHPEYHPESQR